MKDIRIDRLTLRTGPISRADGQRLAALIGVALGRPPGLPAVEAARVQVDVPDQTGRSLEQIADTVAEAIRSALRMEAAT